MAHAAMEETIDVLAPTAKMARLLKHRHQQNWMVITTNTGDWVLLKPGTGGLQGDVLMPDLFGETYEEKLQDWITWKELNTTGNIYAVDPITGERVEIGTTVYADDVNELAIARSAAETEDFERLSTQKLNAGLYVLKLGQNMMKAELSGHYMGPGSRCEYQKAAESEHLPGRWTPCPRYLGNWLHHSGSCAENIERRKRAMQEGYYNCRGFWARPGIPHEHKRGMFLSMIYNTGLSGMECEQPTWTQVQELENTAMHYARKVLGAEGVRVTAEGERHNKSNEEIRRLLRLTNMHEELRIRKLNWLQNIINFFIFFY